MALPQNPAMDLTVGPNAFFWSAQSVRAFYAALAAAPVARVVIGEWVCSKRLPFWQQEIPQAIETLQNAGKQVAITSLALITLKRERHQTADIAGMGLPVEVNDLTALFHIPKGEPFWVGPMVNVYNEDTLRWLAQRRAPHQLLRLPRPCRQWPGHLQARGGGAAAPAGQAAAGAAPRDRNLPRPQPAV